MVSEIDFKFCTTRKDMLGNIKVTPMTKNIISVESNDA